MGFYIDEINDRVFHNYYKNFLTEIGLDDTSVVGADEWGKQMEEMLAEMTAQLKALGYIN